MSYETDKHLVVLAQGGCRHAMNQLLTCRYRSLLRLARRLVRNEDDAQDATQEAVLRIVRSVSQLKSPEAFGKWSEIILRRCCAELLREKLKDEGRTIRSETAVLEAGDGAIERERVEHSLRLREFLRYLGEDAVEVVRLRLLIGLSVRETAAELGVSEGAIKARMYRIRQKTPSFV